jgi:glycosyltransferase involved in cell wall biosynthesis
LPDRLPDGQAWPRISIVTSSFNRAEFIEETIRAVLLQGYPNLEYIIVDGASKDKTLMIIEPYRPFLSCLISEKDSGEYQAYNKGFCKCSGEIITFNSSDDVYLPSTLEDVARKSAENTSVGAVVGGFRRMDFNSRPSGPDVPAVLPGGGPADLMTLAPGTWRLHQQATFYSRAALQASGFYVREDLKYTGDRELLYRVCRKFSVAISERVYAQFRVHSGSLTSASPMQQFKMNMEYAGLHFCYRGDGLDDKRLAVGRQFLAKAYLNRAKAKASMPDAAGALAQAVRFDPLLPARHTFWKVALSLLTPSKL